MTQTEETKLKRSLAQVGKHLTEETKTKISNTLRGRTSPMKGKHQSKEAKAKIGLAQKGNAHFGGHCHTEEAKARMSGAHRGKCFSEEHKAKIGRAGELNTMFGRCSELNPFYGKHHTDETKAKMGGENSVHWCGGISFEPYGLEFNNILKEQIRERDNHTCQICGLPENGDKLAVHHIDYSKKHNNLENLVALCKPCHTRTNHNREGWGFLARHTTNDRQKVRVVRPTKARAKAK